MGVHEIYIIAIQNLKITLDMIHPHSSNYKKMINYCPFTNPFKISSRFSALGEGAFLYIISPCLLYIK